MEKQPSLQDVMQALRNADAAGDTVAAQRLAEIAAKLGNVEQQQPMTAGEVATSAIRNLPSSFGNLVGNVVQAVTNPIDTAKSVLDLGAGIIQNVLPESLVQSIGEDKASREVANKVGQFYADRYGSVEGAKRAIAEDPAGVLADVSTILAGGAAIAPRAVAQPLARAASIIDPLAIAGRTAVQTGRAVGKVGGNVLGMTTGAGSEAISQAFQAGKRGGQAATQFRENISGRADPNEILDIAKANLAEMNRIKQAEYRSGMVNIKKDKTVLGFDEIDTSLRNAENKAAYKGKIVNEQAFNKIQEAKSAVDEWKNADPVEFHTPEGLDALKQRVGDILETIPFEQKTARAAVGEVYNSIKSSIQKQAPTYASTMRSYAEASEQVREIEKALSLGKKASADTAMRKLQSLMRNNVQTNYGQRVKLAQELERAGGTEMMPGLAGQSLQSVTPRGLQTATAIPTGALAYGVGGLPTAGLSLATSSPRLMGELAYGLGATARGLGATTQRAPFIINPQLFNLLFQSGQIEEQANR
jgi:hypothetical protein